MFKKRQRPEAARSRDTSADGDGERVDTSAALAAKKNQRGATGGDGGLIGATTRKSDADVAAKLEDRGEDAALSGLKASDHIAPRPSDDATRLLEIDTEVSMDHRTILERNDAIHKGIKDGSLDKGVYRGMNGYLRYANRGEGAISNAKVSGLLGPTRNTLSNVRSTMRVEYWNASSGTDGGICKDYKETGYCGFGDSCKYAHDRSDYKQGYQLEKEWEDKMKAIEEKKRKRWEARMRRLAAKQGQDGEADQGDSADSSDSSESEDAEDLPEACPNCSNKWEDCKSIPIQTVCGHYFCEDCAMSNYARTPKCMMCSAPTNGIFNSCEALEEKIKAKQSAKQAKKRAKRGIMDPND